MKLVTAKKAVFLARFPLFSFRTCRVQFHEKHAKPNESFMKLTHDVSEEKEAKRKEEENEKI